MRKCHLNTCPVGVATQDPVLRKRFKGQPEHVINYFFFVAEEVRELMAAMGIRPFRRTHRHDRISRQARGHRPLEGQGSRFHRASSRSRRPSARSRSASDEPQDHSSRQRSTADLIAQAQACARTTATPVEISARDQQCPTAPPAPCCRAKSPSAMAMRACRRTRSRSPSTGIAGQSFGAFLAHGVTLDLTGEANDYVGKGLSGGKLIVKPHEQDRLRAGEDRSSSATPCSMARSAANAISAASPASASRCAIPAPSRSSKASAIMAANI